MLWGLIRFWCLEGGVARKVGVLYTVSQASTLLEYPDDGITGQNHSSRAEYFKGEDVWTPSR